MHDGAFITEAGNIMFSEATSSLVRDVTEHTVFAALAAVKHSGFLSVFGHIGSSMNASQWHKLYQAINNNDNSLQLIEGSVVNNDSFSLPSQ